MLRLINIKKNYVMKYQEPVRALRGISLNFRRNEFVAILGPSGCGKTTMLNIIGGLDRYTDGDLVIKNKSTKNYSDRDWDTYRNHSVGFVFQAYNLIGHQTVCKNVELALTIAGVSPKERKERAYAALEKVGLKGMEKKRPNQLSGGQMQRVAIARALVNNPEILLADEPTGALDSETSVQIMDLLKEVAKDRLVIMVTHNPDLAEKYATRIVNMFDGQITGDSNPYSEKEEAKEKHDEVEEVNKGSKKKSSMSFVTATALSLANLFSKSKRTILVAVAGSIGIFGVSTVLAASTGVNMYIHDMQDDMLSSYPLTIAEEAVDYSSLMTGLYSNTDSKIKDFDIKTRVGLNSMVDYLMDKYTDIMSVKTNTIDDDLVQFVKEIPEQYVSAISYNYGIDPTNNIFTDWSYTIPETGSVKETKISLNGLTQRYIGELQTVEGFEQYAQYVDLFTDFMLLMPGEQDYILTQYDLLGEGAHFPQNENEIMLVVEGDQTLTDLVFAQMGYYQEEELMNIAKKAIKKYDENTPQEELDQLDTLYPYRSSFTFEDLMGKKLTYYPHDTIYGTAPRELADSAYNEYSIALLADTDSNGENDEFYVVSYSDNSTFTSMFDAIVYNGMNLSLISNQFENVYMIKMKYDFIPSDPLHSPLIAAFSDSDAKFADFLASPEEDPDPTTGTFVCIPSDQALALMGGSRAMDYSAISVVNIESGDNTTATVTTKLQNILTGQPLEITSFEANKKKTEQTEITAYQYPAEAETSWGEGTEITIAGILKPKKDVQFGCLRRGVYFTKEFQTKYMNDNRNSAFTKNFEAFLEDNMGQRKKAEMYKAFVTFNYPDYSDPDHPVTASGYASCLNGDLNSSFSSLFSKITGVDYGAENETHFRSISGLKQLEIPVIDPVSEEQIDVNFEYRDNLPVKMSIYPVNFQYKNKVNDYLDQWNEKVNITLYDGTPDEKVIRFEDRMELTYTDTISMIISVINTMITIITTALVIFTSLSLVVSSFMIAVITYISVMERVKEIGVIRSLGGRKRDVSRLFIAENLVTGTMSGIIGLVITGIVCIIINLAISPFGVPSIAVLTPTIMLIMLGLSILLSVVAGLIPSLHASRQDPVNALRSE